MSRLARAWMHAPRDWLPFADAASATLPMARLLRLSLFQVAVGMVSTLLIGTLNRVMIVELSVPTWLVASAHWLSFGSASISPGMAARARHLDGRNHDVLWSQHHAIRPDSSLRG